MGFLLHVYIESGPHYGEMIKQRSSYTPYHSIILTVSLGGIEGAVNLDNKADSAAHEWFYIRGCDVEICLVLSRTDSGTVASSLCHRGNRSDNCSGWQIVRVGILVTM